MRQPGADAVESMPSRQFRRAFFPDATDLDWNDWRWQLRNSIKDVDGLGRILKLSVLERSAASRSAGVLPARITPYYASLLDVCNDQQPLRRTVVATSDEGQVTADESADPLDEDNHRPVPCVVHRYPDRVLFLATQLCAVYCRYCTRSRMAGRSADSTGFEKKEWERGVDYVAATPAIRDVVISGGDPLLLSDARLEWLLSRLSSIPHVEIVRIGTKIPAVLPQRITPALARMLKRYHPLWMSLHFTHPDELTPEVAQACARLADAGIPLGSQTVLLAGINDDVAILTRLFHALLRLRVRPYYLFQCDPVAGTSHFRVPVEKGLDILAGLHGHISGYAIPAYVIDAPGGGGKIPLLPEYVEAGEGEGLLLRNYEGNLYRYPQVPAGNGRFSRVG